MIFCRRRVSLADSGYPKHIDDGPAMESFIIPANGLHSLWQQQGPSAPELTILAAEADRAVALALKARSINAPRWCQLPMTPTPPPPVLARLSSPPPMIAPAFAAPAGEMADAPSVDSSDAVADSPRRNKKAKKPDSTELQCAPCDTDPPHHAEPLDPRAQVIEPPPSASAAEVTGPGHHTNEQLITLMK